MKYKIFAFDQIIKIIKILSSRTDIQKILDAITGLILEIATKPIYRNLQLHFNQHKAHKESEFTYVVLVPLSNLHTYFFQIY